VCGIGIRASKGPMALNIVRLEPLHLGPQGAGLLNSPELAQCGCQGAHHHVDATPLQGCFGVGNCLLVVAEVIVCERDETDIKRCKRVARSETETSHHRINGLGEEAHEDTCFAERKIAKRKVGVEIDCSLGRCERPRMSSSHHAQDRKRIVATRIALIQRQGALRRGLTCLQVEFEVIAVARPATDRKDPRERGMGAGQCGVELD